MTKRHAAALYTRREKGAAGGAEQRGPLLLTLSVFAVTIAVVGSPLADGAVGVGAAVVSAGCSTGWLHGPRIQAARGGRVRESQQ
jgi:hypothetical protein